LTPAAAYIDERNEKRAAGMEVPLHVPFAPGAEDLRFAGIRKVDGQSLVLLRAGDLVMVMPMDDVSANRAARIKVGDSIRIKDGVVQGRARRR
jgi:hypothetical protein